MTRPPAHTLLTMAGALCLVGAAISAEIAWLHMRWLAATYGVICGQSPSLTHCAACPTAVALLAGGLGFLALALRARPAKVRSAAR